MGSLHKNTQLILDFLKAPFLVLRFFYYTLMTLLMMLYVILLSMLMILLSILSVVRHLICSSNLNWLLSLNLIYETLWTGAGSSFLILMLQKFNWFCLNSLITLELPKQICMTVGPSLAASLEPFAHRQNVTSLSLFYR